MRLLLVWAQVMRGNIPCSERGPWRIFNALLHALKGTQHSKDLMLESLEGHS